MRIPHGLRAALAGQAAPPAPSSDANFENVSLLLHGDGTNGAQNNTFTDGSANNFTITRTGNTTQGTFSPFSPTGWSGYFDGTGDYIDNTSNYLVSSTTSTFTIEAWIYMTAAPTDDANDIPAMISVNCGGGNSSINYMAFGPISNQKLRIRWFDGTSKNAEGSSTLALNTWHHVACSVSSNAIKMFVNGVQETLTGTTTLTNRSGDANGFALGQTFTYANYSGYISNARVVTGTALYTSNFTPPTSPLTAITNTSLLTLQDNRFIDNSANNFAITRFGDTKIEAFSPFNPTAAYSASTHGGSGYFDPIGDRIYCTPSNLTDEFTIEGWWYANAFPTSSPAAFFGNWSTGCLLRYTNHGWIEWYMPGASGSAAYTLTTGQWYHMAVSRDSSNVVRVFANGVQLFSLTGSASITMTNFCIGAENTSSGDKWNGYISGFRILNGTCLYTSGFTPPTAPPTAITNTNLLVNFTNGGIIDNASKNVLETVGNAQISTSVKKYGTGSMYFDGTGDYLYKPSDNMTSLGGDFTVEAWLYRAVSGVLHPIINVGDYNGSTGIVFYVSSGNALAIYTNNALAMSGGTISATTWTHVAMVRSGTGSGNMKLYVDGVSVGTPATNTATFSGRLQAGADFYNSTITNYFNGYIDDLRITKGVARYTANFTPPTEAFPDL